ncbi:MAG: hypothetical protein OXQ90_02250 [Gammaproteobacteria bacterium]|nr:hypothetical protein [Gammaproteobacteria bacterium]
MTTTEHGQRLSRSVAGRPAARTVAQGSLCRASFGVAVLAALGLAAEQDPPTERGVEPERLDVVFSRLARQQRTLDALLEIVLKLEKVAGHPDAAAALLSHEGEPTDRLRSALVEVAKRRSRRVDASPDPATVPAGTRPTEGLRPEVVYAQLAPGDAPRVLLTARGVLFEVAAGQTIRLGEDTIHVRGVRRSPDAGVDVEISVNGEAPFVGRAGR